MKSLFSRLQSYRPRPERDSKEDFFTEALCYVLEKNPEVLREYIRFIWGEGLPEGEINSEEIETQIMLGSKRPDATITFKINDLNYIIICEHKIGSIESDKQLLTYKSDLNALAPDANRKKLIYITKYFEEDLSTEPDRNLRWNDIYPELNKFENENLVNEKYKEIYKEFLTFMDESEMTNSKKFTAVEMASLTSVPKLIKLMDQCLEGKAWKILLELSVTSKVDDTGWQLSKNNRWSYSRYLLKTDGNKNSLSVNIGVLFDLENTESQYGFEATDNDYPELLIWLSSPPKKEIREEFEAYGKSLSEYCNSLVNGDKWQIVSGNFSSVIVSVNRSLKKFTNDEDKQIENIQYWFADHLGALKEYIDKNPIKKFLEESQTETQK